MAVENGAVIRTNAEVTEILCDGGSAVGVRLADGLEYRAKTIVSNCTPYRTILELIPRQSHVSQLFPEDYVNHIRHVGTKYKMSIYNTNAIFL